MSSLKQIAVYPSSDDLSPSLKRGLCELLGLDFVGLGDSPWPGNIAGLIDVSEKGLPSAWRSGTRIPVFRVMRGRAASEFHSHPVVRFGDSETLEKIFQGREIPHEPLRFCSGVTLQPADEVLGWYGAEPVWVLRRREGVDTDLVSLPLPELGDGEMIFDHLNPYQFVRLLPLVHFLRRITGAAFEAGPPFRACLMFDDPNLRWSSYGFVPYKRLLSLASEVGFHVAFATVPIDGWSTHRATAKLFRDNRQFISLVVHGNDHARAELGQDRSKREYLDLMAQSLRRIAWLERRSGVAVERIVVPPHEALVPNAAEALLELGLEGASVTPWSLRIWNPGRDWPQTFGLEPACWMNRFPVISRFDLSGDPIGAIAISAFLGRPIVLFEHHEVLADGLEPLSRTAQQINALGPVEWCSLGTMFRNNVKRTCEHDTLWCEPFSSRFFCGIPSGIQMAGIRPSAARPADATWNAVVTSARGEKQHIRGLRPGGRICTEPGDSLEFVASELGTTIQNNFRSPGLQIAALSRRLLCEARDRLAPFRRAVVKG